MSLVFPTHNHNKMDHRLCSLVHSISTTAMSLYGTVHNILSILKTQQKPETLIKRKFILLSVYPCQLFHGCQHLFQGTLIMPLYFLLSFACKRWHKNEKVLFSTSSWVHLILLEKHFVNSCTACSKMSGILTTVKFKHYQNKST